MQWVNTAGANVYQHTDRCHFEHFFTPRIEIIKTTGNRYIIDYVCAVHQPPLVRAIDRYAMVWRVLDNRLYGFLCDTAIQIIQVNLVVSVFFFSVTLSPCLSLFLSLCLSFSFSMSLSDSICLVFSCVSCALETNGRWLAAEMAQIYCNDDFNIINGVGRHHHSGVTWGLYDWRSGRSG